MKSDKSAPEGEPLFSNLRKSHLDHVEIEIKLGRTLLGMAQFEYGRRNAPAWQKNLQLARQAAEGAWAGLRRVERLDPEEQLAIEGKIAGLEADIRRLFPPDNI